MEKMICLYLVDRLQHLAKEKLTNPDDSISYDYVVGLLMVLRQMVEQVLCIRKDIFQMLTEDDVNQFYNDIYNTIAQTNPINKIAETLCPKPFFVDKHADDYMTAVRRLQRGSKCASCKREATDAPRIECGHAYIISLQIFTKGL